jgi:hypothetical protein
MLDAWLTDLDACWSSWRDGTVDVDLPQRYHIAYVVASTVVPPRPIFDGDCQRIYAIDPAE